MASKKDERELIEGLRAGRESAYRRLVEEFSDRLYRLALRILRQEEDAREVLQEVLVKVVSKIPDFQGGSSLYTWLYRITVNEALMRLRANAGRQREESFENLLPRYEAGIVLDRGSDWSLLPDAKFQEDEFRDFVRLCVNELPQGLKTAYVLKDMEELTEEEVCEILQITKPTMKNRVHRARMILRKRIEQRYAT